MPPCCRFRVTDLHFGLSFQPHSRQEGSQFHPGGCGEGEGVEPQVGIHSPAQGFRSPGGIAPARRLCLREAESVQSEEQLSESLAGLQLDLNGLCETDRGGGVSPL